MTRRFATLFWLTVDIALIVLFFRFATACNPFFFLPPFHEGPHRIQAVTPADIQRGQAVEMCLESWVRENGNPEADYSDVDLARLVIVRVGGDGVIGSKDGTTWQTDARENGDTIFINEGVGTSEFVGLERHELVHLVQSYHPELIGADRDIHWPPPFNYCQVPLAIFRS